MLVVKFGSCTAVPYFLRPVPLLYQKLENGPGNGEKKERKMKMVGLK